MPDRGRPRIYDPGEVAEKIESYLSEIPEEGVPIISEFCFQKNISRATLYRLAKEDDRMNRSLDRMQSMKEARLERLTLERKINPAMAIFSLKQLGWSDRKKVLFEDQQKTIKIGFVGKGEG